MMEVVQRDDNEEEAWENLLVNIHYPLPIQELLRFEAGMWDYVCSGPFTPKLFSTLDCNDANH